MGWGNTKSEKAEKDALLVVACWIGLGILFLIIYFNNWQFQFWIRDLPVIGGLSGRTSFILWACIFIAGPVINFSRLKKFFYKQLENSP